MFFLLSCRAAHVHSLQLARKQAWFSCNLGGLCYIALVLMTAVDLRNVELTSLT